MHLLVKEKINKAYSVLGVINRNFMHMNKSTFVLLYKAMVRLPLHTLHTHLMALCPGLPG